MDRHHVRLTCLGTTTAIADAAAANLLAQSPSEDFTLADQLVVVPGARAGRLLLKALVQRAAALGRGFDPPEIVTVGGLIERLLDAPPDLPPPATSLERRLAWASVFAAADAGHVHPFVPHGSAPDRRLWDRLAVHATRTEDQLGVASLGFEAAATATEKLGGDATRCRLLSALSEHVEAKLAEAGLSTPLHYRRTLILRAALRAERVVLVGVLELGGVQRAALARVPHLQILVPADECDRDRFDSLGCPNIGWASEELPIADEHVISAHAAQDQAEAAMRFLADRVTERPGLACDEVAIGVGDPGLAEPLKIAGQDAGVEIHDAAGTPLLATPVGRFLRALLAWRTTRLPADFAVLVRRPVVERWLRGDDGDPIALLDQVRGERLPATLDQDLGDDAGAVVRRCVQSLDDLLQNDDLSSMLRTLPWDDADLSAIVELEAIDRTVRAIAPVLLGDADVTALVMELVLDLAEAVQLPAEPRERSVEALGWLELLFEPAPNIVVIGMNEGSVPSSGGQDPLLPESLRQLLGLPTRETRAARDAVILHGLLRRTKSLRLIAGRVSAEGDPLVPSRLLLSCRGTALAERVLKLTDASKALAGERRWRRASAGRNEFTVPSPPLSARDIATISATAFRDYLACGTRFWLGRIERLRDVDDDAQELGLPDAGTVMHEVLKRFGTDAILKKERNAASLASALHDLMDAVAREKFGTHPLPAVRLQLQAFRPRIDAFAAWQAEAVRAGWEIRDVERGMPEETTLQPEGGTAIRLKGRVDRIDFHAGRNVWRIIDYKTTDSGKSPREAHRRGSKGDGDWMDLQLPLYRFGFAPTLLKSAPLSSIEVGYVRMPADPALAGWCDAAFSQAECDDAVAKAIDIVTKIRRGEFPLGEPMGKDDPYAGILQSLVFGVDDDGSSRGDTEESP